MDIEKMNMTIEKIKTYKAMIDVNFDEIKNTFKNINYYYKTSNSDSLNDLQEQLTNKFRTIQNIHENDLDYLIKKIETYKETSHKVTQIFKDIN